MWCWKEEADSKKCELNGGLLRGEHHKAHGEKSPAVMGCAYRRMPEITGERAMCAENQVFRFRIDKEKGV